MQLQVKMDTSLGSSESGRSGRMSHFEYQEAPTEGLQDGATTIMLRGLVRSINLEGFLKLLRNISSNYDLVYVPVGNKRATNLGLAFINYEDHFAARRAFQQLYEARSPHTFRMVKRAYVQGLGPNLAFVLSEAPVMKHGMAVFRDGQRLKDISSLVQRHVTDDMLAEARQLMTRIHTEQRESRQERNSETENSSDSTAFSEVSDHRSNSSRGSAHGSGRGSAHGSVHGSAHSGSSGHMPMPKQHVNPAAWLAPQPRRDGGNIPGSWYLQDYPGNSSRPYRDHSHLHQMPVAPPIPPVMAEPETFLSWEASSPSQQSGTTYNVNPQPGGRLLFDL